MLTYAYDGLKPDYHPFCIGHPLCKDPLAKEAQTAYFKWKQRKSTEKDGHSPAHPRESQIIDIGDFLLIPASKSPSTGPRFYRHLLSTTKQWYRLQSVYTAAQCHHYINKNPCASEIVVPKKFILSLDATEFALIEQKISSFPLSRHEEHSLTRRQATSLAKCIFSECVHPFDEQNRICLTKDRKIVILNTFPSEKCVQAFTQQFLLGQFLLDTSVLPQQLYKTAQLKTFCAPSVRAEIEKLETHEVEQNVTMFMMKVAIGLFTVFAVPYFTPSLPAPIQTGLTWVTGYKIGIWWMQFWRIQYAYHQRSSSGT